MKWFLSPKGQRKFHGLMTLFWIVMVPPAVLLFGSSVLYVVLVSQYANYISEFTAWLAARTEVRAQLLQESDTVTQREMRDLMRRTEAQNYAILLWLRQIDLDTHELP